jgi:hypothetical protein
MIEVREGNAVTAYLEGDIDVLLHCCNDKKIMGSGIAKEIRRRIPEAYKDYMAVEGDIQLGSISSSEGCYNLHAQKGYGRDKKRYINYGAFAICLNKVEQRLILDSLQRNVTMGEQVIGFPYLIGCALAGGSWEIVSEMLEHQFSGYKLVAYKL